jgi:ADP-heptose:LPS heptosyltransferase
MLREYAEAADMLERALRFNPDNKTAFLYRAKALHASRRYEEAIPAYEKILAQDPNDKHAMWALSWDYGGEIRDFADTAALMRCLDLVISVDSSPAHLAGALGRPVWTLLPSMPSWRWRRDGSSHPWYPSMRLCRQDLHQTWADVLAQVKEELAQLLRDRAQA